MKFDKEFMENNWKAWMGVTYMLICIFDFVGAPVLWSIVQFWETEAANDAFRQWQPLTLQGGGFFHMAMGAVLGISAFNKNGAAATPDATPTAAAPRPVPSTLPPPPPPSGAVPPPPPPVGIPKPTL